MSRALPVAVGDLLAAQEGILTRTQARDCGLTDKFITAAVRSGRWQRLHTGVYAAFSGQPGRASLRWAALLRAGPAAALSHQTAAELDGLLTTPSPVIHLTVPRGRRVAPIGGAVLHYSGRLGWARHPRLSPPRTRLEETVLDLAEAAADLDAAFSWIFRACGSGRVSAVRLSWAMAQRRRMRWRAELSAALDLGAGGVHSVLEFRYLYRVERPHGLRAGIRQYPVLRAGRRQYQDVTYEDYGVIAELDGQAAHPAGSRWRDVHRDNANAAAGQVTLRYGWADVTEHPCQVASQVAAALTARGWTGVPRRCGTSCAWPAGNRR